MLQQIGLGTLGPVFRAYDSGRDRLVAVKLFQLDLDRDRLTRFVEALERLLEAHEPHASLPTPLATGVAGTAAYLAQSFVAATSVDVLLRQHGPMPLDHALRTASQAAGALDAGLGHDLLHGALHPGDLLVAAEQTWVTGLGVTRALEQVGLRAPLRVPYSAPERTSSARWEHRADVFSLAAILAELMTGAPVGAGGAVAIDRRPDIPGSRRTALVRVFARAMAPRPEDRFLTAAAFVRELRHAAEGMPERVGDALDELPLVVTPDEARLAPVHSVEGPVFRLGAVADALAAGGSGEAAELEISVRGDDPEIIIDGEDRGETGEISTDDARQWTLPLPLNDGRTASPLAAFGREAGDQVPVALANDRHLSEGSLELPTGGHVVSGAEVPVAPMRAMSVDSLPTPQLDDPPFSRPVLSTPPSDATRSALWPLSLALVVGLVVGAAVGFIGFITRNAASPDSVSAQRALPPVSPRGSTPNLAADMSPPAGTTGRVPMGTSAPSAPSDADSAPDVAAAATSSPGPVHAGPTARRPPRSAANTPVEPSTRGRTSPEASASTVMRDARDSRPDALGRVLVRSLPAGARVLLDGKDVGSTPIPLRAVPFGSHTLRVLSDGYVAADRQVVLTPDQPAQSLIVDLVPMRGTPPAAAATPTEPRQSGPTAGLIVESRPAGATVFLNDRRLGTTPLMMDAVAAGVHAIRLELDGYRRWSSSVRVAVGERNRVAASLEH